jgi:hypothetical protein
MSEESIKLEAARQRLAMLLANLAIDYKLADADMVRLLAGEINYWSTTMGEAQ